MFKQKRIAMATLAVLVSFSTMMAPKANAAALVFPWLPGFKKGFLNSNMQMKGVIVGMWLTTCFFSFPVCILDEEAQTNTGLVLTGEDLRQQGYNDAVATEYEKLMVLLRSQKAVLQITAGDSRASVRAAVNKIMPGASDELISILLEQAMLTTQPVGSY